MLSLYFDNENKNEYFFVNNEWFSYPIGRSFIDLISVDFAKRDLSDESAIKTNPLLALFKDYMLINEIKQSNIDFIKTIVNYKIATDYVLNMDNEDFNSLEINTRFYAYQELFNNPLSGTNTVISHIPKPSNVTEIDKATSVIDETLPSEKDIVKKYKNCKFNLIEVYFVTTLEEALYLSFMKMVSSKVMVKKCKCCDKYFIPEGRIDTEYCNRIAPNSKKTCIEIGAMKKYHEKSNNNPILKEFQKEYKKMNARVRLKKITQAGFYKWSESARELRELALKSNWDEFKFIEELNKLEV